MRKGLGARLSACLSMIEGATSFTDVGTDHGMLPVRAVTEGRVSRAVAVDISEPSLMKAKLLAEREGAAVDAVLGDGLTRVNAEDAEIVVIAGMGGHEIVKILSEAPFPLARCILVPHTHAVTVRRYLKERDAAIKRDVVVKESGHYYPVILADFREHWREGDSVYVGREGDALTEYVRMRREKITRYLEHGDDPALREEKEALDNVYRS